MYEEAIELLLSRDNDIQADKRTLELLSSNSISISEAWRHLIRLKNGAIRFNACQDFLRMQLGSGTLEQAGDMRIAFVSEHGIQVELPGENSEDQRIFVAIPSIERIIDNPFKTISADKYETFLEEYVKLLHIPNSIPSRVRLRVSPGSQNWSRFTCWLYYVFVLHPKDMLSGRYGAEYWESELDKQRSLRINKDASDKESWAHQRLTADHFKKTLYQNLLPFDMPVMFHAPYRMPIPIEEFFSISGC